MTNLDINRVRNMLFWFLKEFPLYILPFAVSQLALWIVVSKFIREKKFTNKTVVAFTSIHYNGNSKSVFDSMKNLEKYECYWIARNIKSLKDVMENKGQAIYAFFPIISMKFLLNTDILVTSDSSLDYLFLHKRPKVVQLWHAICTKAMLPHENNFDVWCVSSDYIKQRYVELYKLPSNKFYSTGYPAIDILYKHLHNSELRGEFNKTYKIDSKIILYTPTWDCGLWGWGDQYNQFEKLCIFCKNNDLTVILRLHPLAKINKRNLRRIVQKYNVLWLDMDKEPDTMKLLALSDILITDWSSTCVDFLLTKRPIIYLEVKKEFFTKSRGEAEAPPELRAGEIVLGNEELYDALDIVLTKGNRFKRKQDESLKLLHGDVDGKASERVSKVIEKLSNK